MKQKKKKFTVFVLYIDYNNSCSFTLLNKKKKKKKLSEMS